VISVTIYLFVADASLSRRAGLLRASDEPLPSLRSVQGLECLAFRGGQVDLHYNQLNMLIYKVNYKKTFFHPTINQLFSLINTPDTIILFLLIKTAEYTDSTAFYLVVPLPPISASRFLTLQINLDRKT